MSGESARTVMLRADELAACTEVPGEITRPYGTAALVAAARLVERWMHEAGLVTHTDAIGNVIGRSGRPGLPTIVLGSHIDSVRNAGRYDGPLGILVALAGTERVAGDVPAIAIEIVAFADEEGMRFRPAYLASRAWAGLLPESELEGTDDDGVTLADAVRFMGGEPARIGDAARRGDDLIGYLEVHIEQGPVLEGEDVPVGVVTAIAGQSRGSVRLIGRAGHAGNTPPHLRADALAGAAEVVLAIERELLATPGLVATAGRIENEPNVANVIPGAVTLSYDVRHQDDSEKEAAVERLRAEAAAIAARRGLTLEWRHLQDHPAQPMSPRLRTRLVDAIAATGTTVRELPSGAGHDAVSVAHVTPEVAMLFVRCKGGLSHHPDESVTEDDVAVAIDVVARFLTGLADDTHP